MSNEQTIEKHRWEIDGYGKAPFKVVGIFEMPPRSLQEANPSAYNRAMKDLPSGYHCGTCGICGAPLKVNYLIESADGQRFSVGCECVNKAGNENTTTEMKELKRKRDKERRELRRAEAKKAKEDLQREKNGGKTNNEIEMEKMEQRSKLIAKYNLAVTRILQPIIDLVEDGKRGFCDSIAGDMRGAKPPYGRARTIVVEICAKQAGRKGSKEYDKEASRIEKLIDKAIAKGDEGREEWRKI